jgi:hypothetical protein
VAASTASEEVGVAITTAATASAAATSATMAYGAIPIISQAGRVRTNRPGPMDIIPRQTRTIPTAPALIIPTAEPPLMARIIPTGHPRRPTSITPIAPPI